MAAVERVVLIKARRIELPQLPPDPAGDDLDQAVAEGRISVRRAARIRAARTS